MFLAIAQIAGMGLGQLAIGAIIIAALVAIVYVAASAMGVPIPPWVTKLFWIVVIALVAIFCIRLIMGMG